MFLNHFNILILKNKKYIYYFNTFLNKKYFKKQLPSYHQTLPWKYLYLA
jgi:hypothetical protein